MFFDKEGILGSPGDMFFDGEGILRSPGICSSMEQAFYSQQMINYYSLQF